MPRSIKHTTGGQTYTATSFDVSLTVGAPSGPPSSVTVHFYDASGALIPPGVIRPAHPQPASVAGAKQHTAARVAAIQAKQAELAAFKGALTTPALSGETFQAWVARAFAPYVASVYGLTLA